MEVVAGGVEVGGEGKGGDRSGVESAGISLADLHAAKAEEERFGGDDEAVLVEGVARDEEVGDACFVLEGDEAVALGGAGALTADDLAGHGERLAVAKIDELGGSGGGRVRWAGCHVGSNERPGPGRGFVGILLVDP